MHIPSLAAASLSLSLSPEPSPFPDQKRDSQTIWATPHDTYSSSIGVLGCKINTNRVAYFPQTVDSTNICVSVSYGQRQLYLLRVDQSGGAHDMSYDAWNWLYTGENATTSPSAGGAIPMEVSNVAVSHCRSLIHTDGNKLPLSAANSINFLSSCLQNDPAGWVANNYVALNIADPICTLGVDEACELDWPAANQPTCPHMLGNMTILKDKPVYNILYPSGKKVLASSGASGAPVPGAGAGSPEEAANGSRARPVVILHVGFALAVYTFAYL